MGTILRRASFAYAHNVGHPRGDSWITPPELVEVHPGEASRPGERRQPGWHRLLRR
jgi:hypothetical protein